MTSFRELHFQDSPFLLPNAWDVGSALAFVAARYPAIGTTSFGIASSTGMPDGGRTSKAVTSALAVQLTRLPVHVTTDIEDGYSDDPVEVADYVADLSRLGVAGVNIEDSRDGHLVDPAILAAKISEIKNRCPNMFINARVDNFWFSEDASVDAVVQRSSSYASAGADGIFVPGALAAEDIRQLTMAITLPVNVLAQPALSVPELGLLGIRRVSSGSLPYRAAIDAAVGAVGLLREGGATTVATSYWEMQERLEAFNKTIK